MIYLDAEIQQRREAFGKSMKKIRIKAKISQERLAEIAGLDRKTISRIEKLNIIKKRIPEGISIINHESVDEELNEKVDILSRTNSFEDFKIEVRDWRLKNLFK